MRIFKWLQIFFLLFLTVSIAAYVAQFGVEAHHDGFMLRAAYDVYKGKMLFRDTFTQYGALSTLIQSWAFGLFGPHLLVLKLLTAVCYGLIIIVLWHIYELFLPRILVFLTCLIWIFLAPYFDPSYILLPWSSVYALLFQLIAAFSLLKWLRTKKISWQIAGAVAAALTFWFRQPVGIFLFCSLVLFYIVMRGKGQGIKLKSITPFLFSYVLTHLPFLLWLVLNRALGSWWYQTIQYPSLWGKSFLWYESFPVLMYRRLFPFSFSPLSIWVVFPLIVLYIGYIIVSSRKKANTNAVSLLLLICFCLASWLQYYPVACLRHTYWAATPMIGLLIYAAWNTRFRSWKRIGFFVLLVSLTFPDIYMRLHLFKRKLAQTRSYQMLTRPEILKGMYVPPEQKKEYEVLSDTIAAYETKHPAAFITTTGPDALFSLFDMKSVNCHPFQVNWRWGLYDPLLEKQYQKALFSCIARYKPLVIVFDEDWSPTPNGYVRLTKRPSLLRNALYAPR